MSTTSTHAHEGRVTRDAIDALYATGHWLFSRQRYIDAASVFRMIVLCAPDEERGYVGLGLCHESMGQAAVALEIYGAATLAVTHAPRCHVARARVLRDRGLDVDADEALDEAERIAESTNDDDVRALVKRERAS